MGGLTFDQQLAAGGIALALLLFIAATGVTLGMDAKTRGELRFAVACFVISGLSILAVVIWWAVDTDMNPVKRSLLVALIFSAVGIGLVQSVRWAQNRHSRSNE